MNCQTCNHPLANHISRSKKVDGGVVSVYGCLECKCNKRPIDIIIGASEKDTT